jgi:cysteine-rich repeat protein
MRLGEFRNFFGLFLLVGFIGGMIFFSEEVSAACSPAGCFFGDGRNCDSSQCCSHVSSPIFKDVRYGDTNWGDCLVPSSEPNCDCRMYIPTQTVYCADWTASISKGTVCVVNYEPEVEEVCEPDCACAANTCVDRTCSDGCGGTCLGTKCCTVCGDGILGPKKCENCDDGNVVSGDGCSSTCKLEVYDADSCGDGIVFLRKEQCDDGNKVSGDGCSSTCRTESYNDDFCGDGVLWVGEEECDDGNRISGDGCSSGCLDSANYWANADGVPISSANVGDTVKLIAEYVDSASFRVRERDGGVNPDDNILDVAGASKGSMVVGTWVISESDLEKTNDYDDFYFRINGVSGSNSGSLFISEDEDDDPMKIKIVSPVCGEYFREGEEVFIDITAEDPDDIIEGTLRFDGVEREFSNGGIAFPWTFDVTGSIQIVAEGITGRGRKRAISNVMVLDVVSGSLVEGSEYIAACITKPEDFGKFGGSVIEFDASTTRGVRVSNGAPNLLIPGRDAFSWYWTFRAPGVPDITNNVLNSVERSAFNFNATFPISGDNSARLRVEI